jgi:hypothetical protein
LDFIIVSVLGKGMSDRNQIATLYIQRKDIELPAKLADGTRMSNDGYEGELRLWREGKCLNRHRLPVVVRLFRSCHSPSPAKPQVSESILHLLLRLHRAHLVACDELPRRSKWKTVSGLERRRKVSCAENERGKRSENVMQLTLATTMALRKFLKGVINVRREIEG